MLRSKPSEGGERRESELVATEQGSYPLKAPERTLLFLTLGYSPGFTANFGQRRTQKKIPKMHFCGSLADLLAVLFSED
jgi:hypothetical protein